MINEDNRKFYTHTYTHLRNLQYDTYFDFRFIKISYFNNTKLMLDEGKINS